MVELPCVFNIVTFVARFRVFLILYTSRGKLMKDPSYKLKLSWFDRKLGAKMLVADKERERERERERRTDRSHCAARDPDLLGAQRSL